MCNGTDLWISNVIAVNDYLFLLLSSKIKKQNVINKMYKCWFIWAVEAVDDNESDDEEDDEEEVSVFILQIITE